MESDRGWPTTILCGDLRAIFLNSTIVISEGKIMVFNIALVAGDFREEL